jgi:hypothetical protein
MRVDTKSKMREAVEKYFDSNGETLSQFPESIVSVNDDMFHGDADSYYRIGIQAEKIISEYVANRDNPKILIMPSGHGRETRFFRFRYPHAELIACDLDEDAIDFCEKIFNCTPLISSENFSEVNYPNNCDVIWVGSLITHVSELRARELLTLLIKSLKIGGSLIISSHGRYVADILAKGPGYGLDSDGTNMLNKDFKRYGFGYSNYPAMENYGISVVEPDWFTSFFKSLNIPHNLVVSEKFWDNHHDVISLTLN